MINTFQQERYNAMVKSNPKFRTMSVYEKAKAMGVCSSTLRRIEHPGWQPPEERVRELERDNQRLKKMLDQYLDTPKISGVSYQQHLENDTDVVQNAPEGGNPMAYERLRVKIGTDSDGKPKYTQVSGKTQDERNDNIVKAYVNSRRILEFIPEWALQAASAAAQPMPEEPVKELHPLRSVIDEYLAFHFVGKDEDYAYQDGRRLLRFAKNVGEDKSIEEISIVDIQAFLNARVEENISRRTIGDDKRAIKQLYRYAEDRHLIATGLIDWRRVKNGGKKAKTRKAASVAQYADITENICKITDPILQLCVAIVAYTGMRPEELLGLQWEDVDWEKHTIDIKRSVKFPSPSRHRKIGPPKTEASENWIPVIDELWEYLKGHRGESGWIVHDGTGTPFETYNNWRKYWKQTEKYVDLYGQRICEFRKTVASVLIARGADPKSVQRLLRHAKVEITMNTYADFDEETFVSTCGKLGDVKCS